MKEACLVWLFATHTVHRILHAGILEWVAFLFSGPSQQDIGVSHCRWILYNLSHRETQLQRWYYLILSEIMSDLSSFISLSFFGQTFWHFLLGHFICVFFRLRLCYIYTVSLCITSCIYAWFKQLPRSKNISFPIQKSSKAKLELMHVATFT